MSNEEFKKQMVEAIQAAIKSFLPNPEQINQSNCSHGKEGQECGGEKYAELQRQKNERMQEMFQELMERFKKYY